MEVRDYVGILQRRWKIIVALAFIALAVSTVAALRGPRAYEATIRIAVSTSDDSRTDALPYAHFGKYYSWLASEYLADDLSEVIRSDEFAADVATQLNEQVSSASIRDVVRARKTHRILEVTAQAPEPELAARIATAVAEVIRAKGGKYLAQLADQSGQLAVIDRPVPHPATTTGNLLLDIGLRTALGLILGLFLAFLVDYLDSSVRSPRDVERFLGLPVLGEIPTSSR
ncbi:MAG: lipopolysaccharide biosynthesis protein [Chloroflexi bacterium]|nr:lipopolysaccharide biosynthesis protein [Chloroflexota bacterium]